MSNIGGTYDLADQLPSNHEFDDFFFGRRSVPSPSGVRCKPSIRARYVVGWNFWIILCLNHCSDVMHAISCYIGPRYNGTQLHLAPQNRWIFIALCFMVCKWSIFAQSLRGISAIIVPVPVKQPWRIWVRKWYKSAARYEISTTETQTYAYCDTYPITCANYIWIWVPVDTLISVLFF